MAVESNMEYVGELRCVAVHGPSGGRIETDAPVDNHGRGEAFSPTDLVGAAIGTCVLTIMGIKAQQENVDISGTRIRVLKEMIDEPFRRIKSLDISVTFPDGLELTKRQRAVLEHVPKTCPVTRSLHPDVEVVFRFTN